MQRKETKKPAARIIRTFKQARVRQTPAHGQVSQPIHGANVSGVVGSKSQQ